MILMNDFASDEEKSEYYLRLMNEDDVSEVHSLHLKLFPLVYSKGFIKQMFVFPRTAFVLIDVKKNDIIGVASYMLEYCALFSTKMKAYLSTFGIAEGYRNKHLATDLMSVTIKYLYCYRLISDVTLHVQSANTAAYNFYSKYGFTKEGFLQNYYNLERGDKNAYIMRYMIRTVDFSLNNRLKLDRVIESRSMGKRRISLCEKFCF